MKVKEMVEKLLQQDPDDDLLVDDGEEFISVKGVERSDPPGMVEILLKNG